MTEGRDKTPTCVVSSICLLHHATRDKKSLSFFDRVRFTENVSEALKLSPVKET